MKMVGNSNGVVNDRNMIRNPTTDKMEDWTERRTHPRKNNSKNMR